MRIDLRTGQACTNPKATLRKLKHDDRVIRTHINAGVLHMTTRAIDNIILAARFAPRSTLARRRGVKVWF